MLSRSVGVVIQFKVEQKVELFVRSGIDDVAPVWRESEHAMASQIAMDDNGEAKIRFWS